MIAQLLVLLGVLPLQAGLVALNRRTLWLSPGEIRFWGVAFFVVVELAYLTID